MGICGPWREIVFNRLDDSQNRQNGVNNPVMSSSGLARAVRRPHQKSEVASGRLNQKLLVHVFLASHVQPVQSSGIKLMREVPLDPLSPLPLQTLATITLNPPSIAVDRCPLRRLAIPVARATAGLGYISSHPHLSKTKRNLVAVIAIVRHHFLDSVRMHFILAFR